MRFHNRSLFKLVEKDVTIHVVVDVHNLPILKIDPVSLEEVYRVVIDQGHHRRCFQLAFEDCDVISRVVITIHFLLLVRNVEFANIFKANSCSQHHLKLLCVVALP